MKKDSPIVFVVGIVLTLAILYVIFEVFQPVNLIYWITGALFAAVLWLNGLIYVRRKR